MKSKILTMMVTFAAMSTFAQSYVTISGHVTNITNGSPVANHYVQFYTDYYASTPVGMQEQGYVLTDANGYYLDSIPLTDSSGASYSSGILNVYTGDCSNNYIADTLAFGVGSYNLTSNFTICDSVVQSCNASFSYSATTGTEIQFYDYSYSTSQITAWSWDFGDGSVSTVQSPLHTYQNAGYYTVCQTIYSSSGCSDTYCSYVNVTNNCSAYLNSYPDPNNPLIYNFSASSSNFSQTIVSYSWDFGDSSTSTLSNPVHTYSVAGYYSITLSYTTSTGCSGTVAISVYAGGTTGLGVDDPGCDANFNIYPYTSNTFSLYDGTLVMAQHHRLKVQRIHTAHQVHIRLVLQFIQLKDVLPAWKCL
jgi:PKD repeat protein